MAVVTGSFSIREYTERMRSIDLHRCWPFDDGNGARPLLPSILVRKFKWWGDELHSTRSTAIVEDEDDPSKDAAVAAISEGDDILPRSATAMEPSAAPTTGEEGRRTANKGKQRTPKKRSIVELFAAAPLIAGTADADEVNTDEGERWEEEDAIEEEMDVVMRKKKEMKENIMKKKRRKKKKNKGITDELKFETSACEKEKICEPKMISSVQSYMFLNPVCNRKSRKTARRFVEGQKHPTKEKHVQKKHKALRTSMLLSMNQEVAKKVPVHSILKNKKSTTDRNSSKSVSAKAANLIKFYCKSNRHVTFSVKDNIVGNSAACSSMDIPQLQNLCKIFSDVLAASSAMNHSSKSHDLQDANDRPQEVNACETGTHSSVISGIEASSAEKNQSSDSIVNLCQPTVVNSSNSSCSVPEKASFAVMVDLNHAVDADDMDCSIPAASTLSTSCIYSGDPNSRVTSNEKNPNSSADTHLEARLTMSSEPGLVPAPNGKFVSSSDVASSVTLQKNPGSHTSTSCLVVYNKTNERQRQPHVDADANFYRQAEEHQHRSPKGMLGNICYSIGSKKLGESLFTPNSVSTSRSKCQGEDFIGLPLNSQGELIQFHSGTKFSKSYNKQNMEWSSIHGFSANRHVESNGHMNHLEMMRKRVAGPASYRRNQSEKQCYSTRERVRDWLNFAELEDSERLQNQKNEPVNGKDIFLQCNSNLRSHSFNEYRNGDVTYDFCDRVDLQGKCNIAYHSQPAVQPTMRLMGKNVVLGGMNRDYNGFNDGRTWNHNENFAQQTQFSLSENPLSHPTIGRSKGNLLQLFDSTSNFYHMKALEPPANPTNISRPPQWSSRSTDSAIVSNTFKLDMNKHALPPQTFMNKATQFLGSCMPGEGSISTGHFYPAVIASHQQDFRQHMLLNPSLCKHSQRVSTTHSQLQYQGIGKFPQPPLLQQPATNLPQWLLHARHQKRTQLSDPNTLISQPCNVSGANSNHHLSPYHVPMIPLSSRSRGGDADPHTARRHSVSNAAIPSIIPPATATKSSGKTNISMEKKEKEGENSHVPEEPNGEEQMNEHLDKAISMEFQNTDHEKGLCRRVNSSNSSKTDSESRSGPTKLVAGAKHILMPCQRADEEDCRPIHSTIIVRSTDASAKLFGPEKKISNIYNF